jgi:site-specific DNA-cytosine methylase
MGINVLSLFDGMACGLVALKRAGIQVDNYYAAEIDKYAMQIAKKNHPEIIHLGDVQKWREWDLPKIDLLIGGSPCQGFSIAGEGLNFDDPRSKLFFTYVEIRDELHRRNPELQFILENVKMKQAWQDIINDEMGVFPVEINSALVSAQNRKRLYWANWKIEQPEDKGILLRDIIEDGEVGKKSYCIDANYFKGGNPRSYFEDGRRQLVFVGGLEQGRRLDDGKSLSRNYREGYRIYSSLGKAATLSAMPKGGEGGYTGLYQVGIAQDIKGIESMLRVYSAGGKSRTLSTMSGGNREPKVATDEIHYRKLTTLECERLQTLPDGYTEGVSNTQRYKMIGNGWTIDVIVHILKSNPNLM